MVGFGDVFQHTPRELISPPPSSEISPPLLAEDEVILLASEWLILVIQQIQKIHYPYHRKPLIPIQTEAQF